MCVRVLFGGRRRDVDRARAQPGHRIPASSSVITRSYLQASAVGMYRERNRRAVLCSVIARRPLRDGVYGYYIRQPKDLRSATTRQSVTGVVCASEVVVVAASTLVRAPFISRVSRNRLVSAVCRNDDRSGSRLKHRLQRVSATFFFQRVFRSGIFHTRKCPRSAVCCICSGCCWPQRPWSEADLPRTATKTCSRKSMTHSDSTPASGSPRNSAPPSTGRSTRSRLFTVAARDTSVSNGK